ncbi:VOC family protein [Altererythrobacter aquiaggeris]|uniref:VOC family protein n=1 Tax=Aestuarierythrobacter aquiaggeris TaxID=1898396 RepID=UPI003018D10A
MRQILQFGAALLLSACATAGGDIPGDLQSDRRAMEGVQSDAPLPTDVRRATIIVRDMDRSLAFWRDALGLELNYDIEVTLSGVNLPVGEPGTRARLVLLNGNDPYIGWIGLLQPIDPPLPDADKPYPTRLGSGMALMVVNTDDADKRCAAAAAVEGTLMTGPPRRQVYPSRDGKGEIRVRGCNVFDPDGIAVEINQLLD